MNEREPMKCEDCRELLTAIACGELNARDEQRARAHAEGCAACKAALGAFQHAIWAASELPLDEPSPALDERVMAAAAAALAKRTEPRAVAPAWWSQLGATLARLGDWAMSPQVAMASVLVLVVGIGLYALPLHQSEERSALTTVDEVARFPSSSAEEATATGVPVPADELAAAAEEKAGELGKGEAVELGRAGEGRFAPPPEPPAKTKSNAAAAATGGGSAGLAEAKVRSAERARRAELDDQGELPGKAARKPLSAPVPAMEPDAEREAVAAAPAPVAQRPAPAQTASDDARPLGAAVGVTSGAPAADVAQAAADKVADPAAQEGAPASAAPIAPASPAASAAPSAKPVSERAELAKGMQALTAGRLPQAISVLTPLAQRGDGEVRELAQSLLAEALHDAGRCKEALVWYTRVVSRANASARSLELAADCYAKTGNDAKAAELRARARTSTKR